MYLTSRAYLLSSYYLLTSTLYFILPSISHVFYLNRTSLCIHVRTYTRARPASGWERSASRSRTERWCWKLGGEQNPLYYHPILHRWTFRRISIIFRVRSAKAVKITDMNLLKRLGIILAIFSALLIIRTLVAPPHVIVRKTAEDLKAYLCKTDWWDHSFTTSTMEMSIGVFECVSFFLFCCSGGVVLDLGHSFVHCCAKSAVRIQRK